MKAHGAANENGGLGVLTEKQCRVLDLLIENKTSKEIARALGISPYTVDQRIALARGKLGASSRTELAARYRLMRRMPDGSQPDTFAGSEAVQWQAIGQGEGIAQPSADTGTGAVALRPEQNWDLVASATSAREGNFFPTGGQIDHRVGPEVFEGISGTLWRIGAIVATALLLVMTILGLFAIFDQLNDLLA